MNEKTLGDLVEQYYPGLSSEEMNDLLFNATCFPFGNFEKIEENLKELKENTDGTVSGAIEYSYQQMMEILDRTNRQQEEEKQEKGE